MMPSLDLQSPTSQGPQNVNQKLHGQSYRDINMTSNVHRVRDVPKQAGTSINKKQGDVYDEESTEFDLDMESVMDEDNDGAPLKVTTKLPGLTYGQEQGSSFHGGAVLQTVVPSEVLSLVQVDQYTEEKLTVAPSKHEVNPALLQQEIVLVLSDVSSSSNTNNPVKGSVKKVTCLNAVQQGQDALRVDINKLKDACVQYKCVTCGLRLGSREKWRRHRRIHMADRPPFKCAHCGREFKRLNSLTNHQQASADKGDTSRPSCLQPRRIRGKSKSKSIPAGAPDKTDPGRCRFCGETFSEDIAMRVHLKTHPEYRPYRCGQCGKSFTTKVGLQFHGQSKHKAHTHRGEAIQV
ncbi:zinc finger protein 879-like [Alosa sapidissima]|uniref:zinc finger protein 879-like n=1 Tax=Alosa sapidissima TaxID=34773 RepID=UPI001C08651F|nr:zinc finger protein 879-like [Alosa sapidissima]